MFLEDTGVPAVSASHAGDGKAVKTDNTDKAPPT